jgi:hypothetical protein
MWLSVENIQEKDSTVIADVPDLPDLVGSGQSVGGVVSETVGASSNVGGNPPIQVSKHLCISLSIHLHPTQKELEYSSTSFCLNTVH